MGVTSSNTRVGALDGLRGLAVAAVLAFHCGFGWAEGGFLGVSLFFTLSGYLITSLLLAEHAANGRLALRPRCSRPPPPRRPTWRLLRRLRRWCRRRCGSPSTTRRSRATRTPPP